MACTKSGKRGVFHATAKADEFGVPKAAQRSHIPADTASASTPRAPTPTLTTLEAWPSNYVFKNNFIWSHLVTCSTSSSWLLGGAEGPTAIIHPSLSFTWYPSQASHTRRLHTVRLIHPPASLLPQVPPHRLLGHHNSCLMIFLPTALLPLLPEGPS